MSQQGYFLNTALLLNTITGNAGGAITPDALGNFNIVGAGGLTVTGVLATHTLTITGGGLLSAARSDLGAGFDAVPSVGILNFLGGTNINTSSPGGAPGNTLTINLDDSIVLAGSIKIGTTVTVDSFSWGAICSNATGVLSSQAPGVAGTVLMSNGIAALPTFQAIAIPAGFTWQIIVANQDAAADNGYNCNGGGTIQVRLPAAFAINKIFKVTGMNNATGWRITQQAGQQIHWDATHSTTLGAGGYLESTDTYDCVELLCTVANTTWQVISSKGNPTIV